MAATSVTTFRVGSDLRGLIIRIQSKHDTKSGISEMQLLQSNYNAELKMRESLPISSNALKREVMGLALQRESMLGDNLKRRATREGLVSGTPSFFKLVCEAS
ncbi:hypothetical protein JHK87_042476 [Glycine soja]|nr:hypothetical protein JHK87_042476 [Glycine soja]